MENRQAIGLQSIFGQKTRMLRHQLNWTQEVLAAKAGVNAKEMSFIESGQRNCSLKTVVKIANALGERPDLLLSPIYSVHSASKDYHPDNIHVKAFNEPENSHLNKIANTIMQTYPNILHFTVGICNEILDDVAVFWEFPKTPANPSPTIASVKNPSFIAFLHSEDADNRIQKGNFDAFDNQAAIAAATLGLVNVENALYNPITFRGTCVGFLFVIFDKTPPPSDRSRVMVQHLSDLIDLVIHQERTHLETLFATVKTYQYVTGLRDPITEKHTKSVANYCGMIALHMKEKGLLGSDEARFLRAYAALHDIGKLSVPEHIINKNGPLTDTEFAIVKRHTLVGYEVIDKIIALNEPLQDLPCLQMLYDIILNHHEKLDGSGYPNGLTSDHISVPVRIVAVVDIFDALTSWRPYKKAWSVADSIAELHLMPDNNLICKECVLALAEGLVKSGELDSIGGVMLSKPDPLQLN